MDAEFKKEQNGTLFCLVGALEGGFWGRMVPQGCPPQKVNAFPKKHPPESSVIIVPPKSTCLFLQQACSKKRVCQLHAQQGFA
jgi:hypothetical protein